MAISFDSAFGIREQALRLRADRASVLSSNLANIDTPNYKARDIDFQSALAERMGSSGSSVKIRSTHSGHVDVTQSAANSSERLYRIPSQPSLDGNSVEEHVEHAEFMKNSLEFQVAFTLMSGSIKSLNKAIRGD